MKKSPTKSPESTHRTKASKRPDNDGFLAHFRNPALFSYATDAEHLLKQIHDYVKRRADCAQLDLVLHGSTLTRLEIDEVLNAEISLDAAGKLLADKVDRLS